MNEKTYGRLFVENATKRFNHNGLEDKFIRELLKTTNKFFKKEYKQQNVEIHDVEERVNFINAGYTNALLNCFYEEMVRSESPIVKEQGEVLISIIAHFFNDTLPKMMKKEFGVLKNRTLN